MQETWFQSLNQEDPLEKEMATHTIILVWENPWTEEPGGLQSMGSQELGMTQWLNNKIHEFKCEWGKKYLKSTQLSLKGSGRKRIKAY